MWVSKSEGGHARLELLDLLHQLALLRLLLSSQHLLGANELLPGRCQLGAKLLHLPRRLLPLLLTLAVAGEERLVRRLGGLQVAIELGNPGVLLGELVAQVVLDGVRISERAAIRFLALLGAGNIDSIHRRIGSGGIELLREGDASGGLAVVAVEEVEARRLES